MKKILTLVVLLLTVAAPAYAAEFILAHEKNDTTVSVPSTVSHKNLYAVGASVDINGNTQGDLFAAGGSVTVTGNTEKDLFAAGGNVNITGDVGDNARVAGGNISITGPVATDLLVAGGNVTISQKASVGGDLVIAGGNLVVDSEVKGKVIIRGGTVTINGKLDGDVLIQASKALTFGSTSQVLGKISYEGPTNAVVVDGAKVGDIQFTKTVYTNQAQRVGRSLFALATLFKLLALLIAGFILHWLFPRKVESVVAHSNEKPLKSFGVGFLVMVVTPIVGLLLCITVVGFYLGLIVFLAYLLVLILASVFLLFYVGNLVYSWFNKDSALHFNRDMTIGAVALLVVSLVPIIGWVVDCVVFSIALGALVLHLKNDSLINN